MSEAINIKYAGIPDHLKRKFTKMAVIGIRTIITNGIDEASVTCPLCGSAHLHKRGTSNGSKRYYCPQCNHSFVNHAGYDPASLKEFVQGISYGATDAQIAGRCNIRVEEVRDWKKQFGPAIEQAYRVASSDGCGTGAVSEDSLQKTLLFKHPQGYRFCPFTQKQESVRRFCECCEAGTKLRCIQGTLHIPAPPAQQRRCVL